MGAIISAVWRSLTTGPSDCKVVIVGLSNAGKTTVLYRLNLGIVVVTKPTIGSNVEEITHKNLRIQVCFRDKGILLFRLGMSEGETL
jgi:GTPase SAR1 family protein